MDFGAPETHEIFVDYFFIGAFVAFDKDSSILHFVASLIGTKLAKVIHVLVLIVFLS